MTALADLTPRQIAVAALVARGKGPKQIAAELGGLSERRVRVHIAAIAYLIRADASCDARLQVAIWYRSQVPIRQMAG